MKYLIIFGLFLGAINNSVGQNRLADNTTFQETFTAAEIEDLQFLFDFFNSSICKQQSSDDLNACYPEFFNRMEKTKESKNFELDIPIHQQKEVYQAFKDSTFYRIWSFRETQEYNFRDSIPLQGVFRTVFFAQGNRYMEFLSRTADSYEIIKFYYDSILMEGGFIGPGLFASVLLEHDKYNLEDIRIRFIVAIHYLTLNDQYKRAEKIK
ncbi:MAG: hypothetical protein LC670_05910 [Flavobacteriales bacterium]|nr:hypothetical protein [Flavobacteriales bacterium]